MEIKKNWREAAGAFSRLLLKHNMLGVRGGGVKPVRPPTSMHSERPQNIFDIIDAGAQGSGGGNCFYGRLEEA